MLAFVRIVEIANDFARVIDALGEGALDLDGLDNPENGCADPTVIAVALTEASSKAALEPALMNSVPPVIVVPSSSAVRIASP